ncbi:class I adenylate-forming enzyme family protein [Lysinibacillus sp. JNUCC-52]|uniref:class I adenylate-forming enzyme family protein n=1 Tax=Lysinibacillus sp. JNUCC-52 TaxID=2792480 RepID=UPI00193858C7|nr:long-chain-fatty-acid--CoA ligase [Lysinibacillus sp. JNUCC-52]
MNAYLLLSIASSIAPEQEILTFFKRRLTYGQLSKRVGALASRLAADGVKRGDRVGIVSTNSPEVVESFFAAFQLGATIVPINYRAKPEELAYMLRDSGIKVLLIESRYVQSIEQFLTNPMCNIDKTIVIGDDAQGYELYETYIANNEPIIDFADIEEDDIAILLYTSGTTSLPKGVMLTYTQLTNYVMGHTEAATGLPNGASLTCVPNYHVAGATSICNCIYGGRRIVLIRQFEADTWLDTLEQEQVTHAFLVPTMLKRIIDHPRFGQTDFSSLQSLSYGAAPMPFPIIRQAIEMFPLSVDFANAFGMTETTSTVAVLGPDDHKLVGTPEEIARKIERLHSVGKPLPNVDIKILDDSQHELPPNEIGNVYIKTAKAMKGYWNRPDESQETLIDGWINTKDMGYLDEDGYLFLKGRNSDMIIRGGENIAPQEIENVLIAHPEISDAAVIGVPSVEWGEEILAVIIPSNALAPPAIADITAYCRERLASFKCPRIIEFATELPRTSSGKLLKRDLRDQYTTNLVE